MKSCCCNDGSFFLANILNSTFKCQNKLTQILNKIHQNIKNEKMR